METDATAVAEIEVLAVSPTSATAQRAVHGYLEDVATRYYGRPVTPDELEAALAGHPSDDLVAPDGVFLVATTGSGVVCGCVGLARVEDRLGEVRRLHVAEPFRGRGLGRRLMTEVEHRAREMGIDHLRLDTRHDLVESQRLYEAVGYRQTPPHSGGPYSDIWYAKALA